MQPTQEVIQIADIVICLSKISKHRIEHMIQVMAQIVYPKHLHLIWSNHILVYVVLQWTHEIESGKISWSFKLSYCCFQSFNGSITKTVWLRHIWWLTQDSGMLFLRLYRHFTYSNIALYNYPLSQGLEYYDEQSSRNE